jgi:hypothetical protein
MPPVPRRGEARVVWWRKAADTGMARRLLLLAAAVRSTTAPLREVYEDSGSRSAAGVAAYPTRPPAPADCRALRGDDAGCAQVSQCGWSVMAGAPQAQCRTDHVVLHLGDEHRVRARHAIVCAGHESLPLVPARLATLHTTFAAISHPVARSTPRAGPVLSSGDGRPYLYVRETADGRVLSAGVYPVPQRRHPQRRSGAGAAADASLRQALWRETRAGSRVGGPLREHRRRPAPSSGAGPAGRTISCMRCASTGTASSTPRRRAR